MVKFLFTHKHSNFDLLALAWVISLLQDHNVIAAAGVLIVAVLCSKIGHYEATTTPRGTKLK